VKAMIFAAGLGTRLKPLTDTKPKALVEINGIPLLEITIKKLVSFGYFDIVINVHHFAEQIIEFIKVKNNFGIKISISDESNLLLDTGGGLKKAAPLLFGAEPILVHNVDIISDINLKELYEIHKKNDSLTTLAVMERDSSRQFLVNNKNELCGWRNNSTGEIKISKTDEINLHPVAFCGIHVISPQIFKLITEEGVFSVVDLYLRLAKTNKILTSKINSVKWMDVGTLKNITDINL
jgi:NDP-sugar pyrophosphorylase family protein